MKLLIYRNTPPPLRHLAAPGALLIMICMIMV